jgi:hypothetical protein
MGTPKRCFSRTRYLLKPSSSFDQSIALGQTHARILIRTKYLQLTKPSDEEHRQLCRRLSVQIGTILK